MALMDEVKAMTRTQGPKCKIGIYLAQSTTTHRDELQAILDGDELGHATIARWFTDAQRVKVPATSVANHRNGTCSCNAVPLVRPPA
jgi:hypothetical protein